MKTKSPLRARSKKRSARPRQSVAPTLRAKIVRIGNSRGVRLPKAVIEQADLGDEVEIIVGDREVTLKSVKHPRAGWDEAFRKALAELGPDALERERREWADWQNMPNKFDEEEWTW